MTTTPETNEPDLSEYTVEDANAPADAPQTEGPEPKAADPAPETADKGEPDAEPAKLEGKSEEDKKPDPEGDLPLGIKKRLAREERKREDAERKLDEFDRKLAQATQMIEALKAKKEGKEVELDPNDFEDYASYAAAVAAKKGAKPEAKAPEADPEFQQALGDLSEQVRVADAKLWDKLTERKDGKAVWNGTITRQMIIELADVDEPADVLRALMDVSEERRVEIAGMTPRAIRRAFREITSEPKDETKDEKPAPERDPVTGQFRRQSAAPDPINPVGGGSAAEKPLAKLVEEGRTADFIERRNAEDRARTERFGW